MNSEVTNTTAGGNKYFFILPILLLPLFFIQLDNSFDWGDDFAQYLIQARYIAGQIQEIPVSCLDGYGPIIKGPLFSFLISPLLLFDELSTIMIKTIITAGLLISCLLLYSNIKKISSNIPATLAALYLGYHFIIISTKIQILPDLLFTSVLLWGIISLQNVRYSNRYYLKELIIATTLILLKPIGFIFIIVVIIKYLMLPTFQSLFKILILLIVVTGSSVLITNFFENNENNADILWYHSVVWDQFSFNDLLPRALIYWDAFFLFFDNDIPRNLNILNKVILGILLLLGFTGSLVRREFLSVLVLLFVLSIVLFPYDRDPVRILTLIFPMIILLITKGVLILSRYITIKPGILMVPLFGFLLLANIPNMAHSIKSMNNVSGPELLTSKEMLIELKSKVGSNEIVRCSKPWTISYLTGLKTIPLLELTSAEMERNQCQYNWSLVFKEYRSSICCDEDNLVFENKAFAIYQKKP